MINEKHDDLKEAVSHLENLIIETDTKAGRAIIEETVEFVVTETKRAISLITKHYDPEPVIIGQDLSRVEQDHFEKIQKHLKALGWTPSDTPVKPGLKAGKWVEYGDTQEGIQLFISNSDDVVKTIFLDGFKNDSSYHIGSFKPHTFTEPDLALLNTDEVTYELKTRGNEFYVYWMDNRENGGEYIGNLVDTAHLAIESAFNQAQAMNIRDNLVKGLVKS